MFVIAFIIVVNESLKLTLYIVQSPFVATMTFVIVREARALGGLHSYIFSVLI